MSTTEHTINDAVAGALRATRRAWRYKNVVSSENTGMLKGSNRRPDILILEPSVSPVVIETEVLPALTVEAEALSRLGEKISTSGRAVLSAIAVRLPQRLRSKQHGHELTNEIETSSDFEMALYTGTSSFNSVRWPKSGWILGTVADLSILTQSASVPPDIIEHAADKLVEGVSEAAALMDEMTIYHPHAMDVICRELRQEDGPQTRRMAATILANAFVFQESLASGPGELSTVRSLGSLQASGDLTKSVVLAEWKKILRVNYWPIFDIARRILEEIPATASKDLIFRLTGTAERLVENRLMHSHDLTGAVFQRLISDRKFLAAYYTTPASASLLIGLAITPMSPLSVAQDWGDPSKVAAIRLADFACGTGTLITTAYQRIGQLHELAGGDSEQIHPAMMAEVIIGCDILPAAAHLTASMLSGAHPTVKYKKSSIMTFAYGLQLNGSIALGSLDLLEYQKKMEIIAVTAKSSGGESESEEDIWTALPYGVFDIVVMNPPFTRSTGHEGKKVGIPNPMFAAFSTSKEVQKRMATTIEKMTKGTSAHGNAGEASIFLVLADRKVKIGGVLALVMPLSLLSGEAWEKSRQRIIDKYVNIILVTIAGASDDEMSFSADTGMGECLIVAQRAKGDTPVAGEKIERASTRGIFVVLKERPSSQLLGSNVARQIHELVRGGKIRRLEDGPIGGTPVSFGNEVVGQALDAPIPSSGPWNPTRIRDLSLAQSAYQIAVSRMLWLPGMDRADAREIPVTSVGSIGKIGPYHSDIDGLTQSGGIRGPLEVVNWDGEGTVTYPVLWNHDATRERTMRFEADCAGFPRVAESKEEQDAVDKKLKRVKESASHCHFNENFRFNSQSTAMQFTTRKTIGGRAWTSILLSTEEQEKALVLWANTSLGILLHWYHANRQQAGRGNVPITSLENLPILNVSTLPRDRIRLASTLFDNISNQPLLPVNDIAFDPVRRELDDRFVIDVLKLPQAFIANDGPMDLLRKKLSNEPSIQGSKKPDEPIVVKLKKKHKA